MKDEVYIVGFQRGELRYLISVLDEKFISMVHDTAYDEFDLSIVKGIIERLKGKL